MSETLLLRQSSMAFTNKAEAVREDAEKAIPDAGEEGAPDFIGFTELGAEEEARIVARRCREAGYFYHKHSTVGLAVHPKHKVVEVGGIDVLQAFSGDHDSDPHRRRGIVEVTVETPEGNIVTVHEAHWITDDPGDEQRTARRRKQSEAMAERVELHSKGRRVSFWMGDINSNERRRPHNSDEVQRPLHRAGLISIFDALDTYPATHDTRRTIDVVGHHDEDGRVEPVSVKVDDDRNSDHWLVNATYKIVARNRR